MICQNQITGLPKHLCRLQGLLPQQQCLNARRSRCINPKTQPQICGPYWQFDVVITIGCFDCVRNSLLLLIKEEHHYLQVQTRRSLKMQL
ncbi:hypothetical protein CBM2637_B110321 [Cupriavidus taiwanensis]|nr:hypothetical protein CBM2637_B110321 [Cupriavidus taiwanensis]